MIKTAIIAICVLIVLAGAAYFLGLLPPPGTPPKTPTPPTASPTPSPVPSPKPSTTPSPPTTPTGKEVTFDFAVTEITGSGLSRTVTARLKNIGAANAHNVWAKVEVFSQGSTVKLGGKDSIRVDIGTLNAGATVTKQVTLEFSILDGLKIQQNGARFALSVYSDEATQTLYYDYQP